MLTPGRKPLSTKPSRLKWKHSITGPLKLWFRMLLGSSPNEQTSSTVFLFNHLMAVTNTTLSLFSGHVTLHATVMKCLWQRFVLQNAFHRLHNMTIIGLTVFQDKTVNNSLKILSAGLLKQIIAAHVGT